MRNRMLFDPGVSIIIVEAKEVAGVYGIIRSVNAR